MKKETLIGFKVGFQAQDTAKRIEVGERRARARKREAAKVERERKHADKWQASLKEKGIL